MKSILGISNSSVVWVKIMSGVRKQRIRIVYLISWGRSFFFIVVCIVSCLVLIWIEDWGINTFMRFRKLGWTDEDVSVICLGTMNWGEQCDEEEAHNQMDYAVSKDVNFFDTAEFYPIPPNRESSGLTEKWIGNWFEKTGKRDDIFLASKVVSRNEGCDWIRGTPRLSRKQVMEAIDGSLERLKTDRIDLYQIHWPERRTNFFGKRGYTHVDDDGVEILETLEAMSDLVKAGKIRYVGISNETPWGVMEYLRLAKEHDLPRIVSIQNPYSLIMREFEYGLAEMVIREKIGLMVYGALSMGVLTGKYLNGACPKGSRFDYSPRNQERYNPPEAQKAIEAYVELARKHDMDPATLAQAFVNDREFVMSTIIGATNLDQLKVNIASVDVTLSEEVLAEIEDLHRVMPNVIS